MRAGAQGLIEEGKFKGRKFLIPSEVYVENGQMGGTSKFSLACLIHHKFIPSGGCLDCKEELATQQKLNAEIGL